MKVISELKILFENLLPMRNYETLIGNLLRAYNKTLAVTESCTGGLVSSLLTDISGSSDYIFANFVTYSNEAKEKYLKVSHETLEQYGAVSEQTAREMAKGLLEETGCDFALSTTGIAGPSGGTDKKPVGLMYIGIADKNNCKVIKILQPEFLQRRFMKLFFARKALEELYQYLSEVL